MPHEVQSKQGDTKTSLIESISASRFFDKQNALKGGGSKGKKRIPLNGTDYRQPRRKSWSVVVHDVHANEIGKPVRTMFVYGKENSRIRQARTAEPMPKPIHRLGLECFLSVRHVLANVCSSSPPNHCQMLAYYGLFDSKCYRHKDDHEKKVLHSMLLGDMTADDAANTSKGAMVAGSDVLIYSVGKLPVLFCWCYPPSDGPFASRELHEVHYHMSIDLLHGTLFVFKAIDDLHFYHEVVIDWTSADAEATGCRFAFVFRWLDKTSDSCCFTGSQV